MMPIDDELRELLQARAAKLDPAPDPLAGIEDRARGLKRRRTVASMTSAVVVVAAIAVAVPLLSTSSHTARKPTSYASSGPSATASPAVADADVLDPQHPWRLRGSEPDQSTLAADLHAWTTLHPGSTFQPLYGYTFGAQEEHEALVFAAYGGSGGDRYGLFLKTGSDPQLLVDEPLPADTKVLAFALPPVAEESTLIVVAAPTVDDILYSYTGAEKDYGGIKLPPATGATVQSDAGIGVTQLTGDPFVDQIRVKEDDGTVITQPAPDYVPPYRGMPVNLLSWILRGDASKGPAESAALQAFADSQGKPVADAHYVALVADTTHGVRYTLGQAWITGDHQAHTFAYVTGGTNGPATFLGPITDDDPPFLALVLDSLPGSSTDALVVLSRPMIGEISYSPSATADFVGVASGRSDLGSYGVVDRSTTPGDERVKVTRGDDSVLLEGPLAPFLCGAKECG